MIPTLMSFIAFRFGKRGPRRSRDGLLSPLDLCPRVLGPPANGNQDSGSHNVSTGGTDVSDLAF